MTSVACDVAIIGGGLGGLAACCGLLARGFNAHVFEAAPALRTSTATVLGLAPNAFTALDSLHPGISPGIRAGGEHHETWSVYKHNPEVTGPPAIDKFPAPEGHVGVKWSTVQNVLSALVPAEAVHCGYKATGYTELNEEEGGGVRVHFKDKPDITARFVVAADGLRSALRATMIPNDPGPRYLGHMNWNALLRNPGHSVVQGNEPGEMRIYLEDEPQPTAHMGGQWRTMLMVADAGSGYTFWQLRKQFDKPSFTNAVDYISTAAHDTNMCSDTEASKQQSETVTTSEDNNSGKEAAGSKPSFPQVVGGGLGVPGSKARVLQLLRQSGFGEAAAAVVEATDEGLIFERAMLDRIPLDELGVGVSSPGRRVLLLGDAMHAMHSGPSQGGRSAFEDAHQLVLALEQHRDQLGWATAAAVSDGGKADGALQDADALSREQAALAAVVKQYEDARLARVCRIQRYSAEHCGSQSVREAASAHLGYELPATAEQRRQRQAEFIKWTGQYPANLTGDPGSVYWKPL